VQRFNVEHDVEQIFVVTGENLQAGVLAADDRNLGIMRMLRTPFFMAKTPGSAAISS